MGVSSIPLSSRQFARVVAIILAPSFVLAADLRAIDIFTTSARPVATSAVAADPTLALTVAEVDTIDRLNAALSERLPADPASAQIEVRKRLKSLRKDQIAALRKAAIGLATAVQLGVDRTPAIVFDKQAVIYGLTDLTDALNRYRAWTPARD